MRSISNTLLILCLLLISKIGNSQQLNWHHTFGGNQNSSASEGPFAMHEDLNGNIYSIGQFVDSAIFGLDTLIAQGQASYISRQDRNGAYNWAYSLGGNHNVRCLDLVTDDSSNLYIGGYYYDGDDFNPGPGIDSLYPTDTSSRSSDIFLIKLDQNGNYKWGFNAGARNWNFISSLDYWNGQILASGTFADTIDFDPDTSVRLLKSLTSSDIFVNTYDTEGNILICRQIAGPEWEWAVGAKFNTSGSIMVVGSYEGVCDFDPSAANHLLSSPGLRPSYFIAKYENNGRFEWAYDLSVSNLRDFDLHDNRIAIVSEFRNTVDFNLRNGTYNITAVGSDDIVVAVYDTNSYLLHAKSFPSNHSAVISSIDIDANENLYLSGSFYDTLDSDPDSGISNLIARGSYSSSFNIKLDSNLKYINSFMLGSNMGGIQDNLYTSNNQLIVGGLFDTLCVYPNSCHNEIVSLGYYDGFIASYDFGLSTRVNDISSIQYSKDWTLYPNPTSSQFTLKNQFENQKSRVSIFNASGQLILDELIFSDKHQFELIEEGIYFIRLQTDEHVLTKKLIVQH